MRLYSDVAGLIRGEGTEGAEPGPRKKFRQRFEPRKKRKKIPSDVEERKITSSRAARQERMRWGKYLNRKVYNF